MPVCVHFHISQLTSKLAFQNIMNYLRLLLFFFVLLAPLQLTSAAENSDEIEEEQANWNCWVDCIHKEHLDGCLDLFDIERTSCFDKKQMLCGKRCNISERAMREFIKG